MWDSLLLGPLLLDLFRSIQDIYFNLLPGFESE